MWMHGAFFEGVSGKAPAPHPCPLSLASRMSTIVPAAPPPLAVEGETLLCGLPPRPLPCALRRTSRLRLCLRCLREREKHYYVAFHPALSHSHPEVDDCSGCASTARGRGKTLRLRPPPRALCDLHRSRPKRLASTPSCHCVACRESYHPKAASAMRTRPASPCKHPHAAARTTRNRTNTREEIPTRPSTTCRRHEAACRPNHYFYASCPPIVRPPGFVPRTEIRGIVPNVFRCGRA